MLLVPIWSSLGIFHWLMINASIPGGWCLSACVSSGNTTVARAGATWGAITAVMSHLQLCCMLATAQTRILGKADLPPTLVQLVSCSHCLSCRNEDYLQHYRLCLADILPFDVAIEEAGWKCQHAQLQDCIPCTGHFLNHLLIFLYCSFSSKTQVFSQFS